MSQAEQHLAELNVARVRYALDDPRMSDFVDNLDRVNGVAERSEGFIWRLKDDSGNATSIKAVDDPLVIANLSVWASVESLERYVWQTIHKRFYGRKHEWFEKAQGPYFVMWWVASGHRPSIQEAVARLEHLRAHGPTGYAFGWESIATAKLWREARCA
jgi:hypothetical protein